MQQVKEAGVIVEDGVTTPLNKVQEALEAVGVELLDHEGQLRDLQDVFRELGAEWDYMDRNTKAYLATILAGSRQQSRFLALMNDFNRTNELITVSQLSAGEASKQFQTHLTGIEASLARLKAAQEEFLMGLINPDHYKGAIDSLRSLLDIFSGIPPILTLAIAGITGWIAKVIVSIGASQAKTVAQNIQNAATKQSAAASAKAVKGLTAEEISIYKVVAALQAKTAGMKVTIATSLKMHAATLGITLAVGLLIYAIMSGVTALGKWISRHKIAMEDLRESIGAHEEKITVLERERDVLLDLEKEQESLINTVSRTADEERRLAEINHELSTTYAHLSPSVDRFGNVILDTTEYIEEQNKEIKELNLTLLENRQELAEQEFDIDYEDALKDIRNLEREVEKTADTLQQMDFYIDIEHDEDKLKLLEKNRQYYEELLKTQREELESGKAARNALLREQLDLQERILISAVTYHNELDAASRVLAQQVIEGIERPDFEYLAELSPEEAAKAIADYNAEIEKQLKISFDEGVSSHFQEILDQYGESISTYLAEGFTLEKIEERMEIFEEDIRRLLQLDPDFELDLSQFIVGPDIESLKPIIDFQKRIEQLSDENKDLEAEVDALKQLGVPAYRELAEALNSFVREQEQAGETSEAITRGLQVEISAYNEMFAIINKQAGGLTRFQQLLQEANEEFLQTDNINLYNQALSELADMFGLTEQDLKRFMELYSEFEPALNFGTAITSIQEYRESMQDLTSAYHSLAEGQALAADQILNLIEKYPKLAAGMEVNQGIMELDIEILKSVMDAEEDLLKTRLHNIKANLESQKLKAKIELQILEGVLAGHIEGVKTVSEAQSLATEIHEESRNANIQSIDDVGQRFGDFAHFIDGSIDALRNRTLPKFQSFWSGMNTSVLDFVQKSAAPASDWFEAIGQDSIAGALRAAAGKARATDPGGGGEGTGGLLSWDPSGLDSANISAMRARINALQEEIEGLDAAIEGIDKLLDLDFATLDRVADKGGAAAQAVEEYVSQLEQFYNQLRQISHLEAQITRLQEEREFLFEDRPAIVDSLYQEIDAQKQLINLNQQLYEAQVKARDAIADDILAQYNAYVTIEDGLLQITDAYHGMGDAAKENLDDLISLYDNLKDTAEGTASAINNIRSEVVALSREIVDTEIEALEEQFEGLEEAIQGNIDKIHELRDSLFESFDDMQNRADQFDFDTFEQSIGGLLDKINMLEGRRFIISTPLTGEATLRRNIQQTVEQTTTKVDEMHSLQEQTTEIIDRERHTREDIERDVAALNTILERKREIQTQLIEQERELLNYVEERRREHSRIEHNMQREIDNRRRSHEQIEQQLQKEIDRYSKLNNSIEDSSFNIEQLAHDIAMLGIEHDIAVDIGELSIGQVPTDLVDIYGKISNLARRINSDLDSQIDLKQEIFDLTQDIEREIRNVTLEYQRQRKEIQDQIDEIKKLEDDRHKFVSDLLDKELKKYEAIINAKIEILEQERSEQEYQEKVFEEEQERARLIGEMDTLRLDDSHEARARYLELQEELSDQEYELAKLHDERTFELRKSNLEKQLENIKAYIDALKNRNDAIAEANDEHLEMLEEQLEELDEAYNKEIAILNLFVNHVRDVYQDLNTAIQDNLQSLQDNLARQRELHAEEIDAMAEKLQRQRELHQLEIESLQTRVQAIQEIMRFNTYQMNEIFKTQEEIWQNHLQAEAAILEQRIKNLERFLQVYLRLIAMGGLDPNQMRTMIGQTLGGGIVTRGQATGAEARSVNQQLQNPEYAKTEFWRGSQVIVHEDTSSSDKQAAINYIKNIIPQESGLSLSELEQVLTEEELKRLRMAGYDTGGYTGTFQGGKVGILHQKELVLEEGDTSNILEAVKLMRQTAIDFTNPAPTEANGGADHLDIDIHIGKVVGDREGAKLVAKEISKEIITSYRKFGGQIA